MPLRHQIWADSSSYASVAQWTVRHSAIDLPTYKLFNEQCSALASPYQSTCNQQVLPAVWALQDCRFRTKFLMGMEAPRQVCIILAWPLLHHMLGALTVAEPPLSSEKYNSCTVLQQVQLVALLGSGSSVTDSPGEMQIKIGIELASDCLYELANHAWPCSTGSKFSIEERSQALLTLAWSMSML